MRGALVASILLGLASGAPAFELADCNGAGAGTPRCKWFPADMPVPYAFNPDFDEPDLPGTAERDECRLGFLAWEVLAGSEVLFTEVAPVSLACAGSPASVFANDGVNLLTFSDPCDELGPATLGLTLVLSDGGDTMDTNGVTFGRIFDADIIFSEEHTFTDNPGAGSGTCASAFDLRAVAAHEIGHFIGLGHSSVQSATMFFAIAPCDPTRASLDPDDEAGASFIYPLSSCGASPIAEAFPPAICSGDPLILSARRSTIPGCAAIEYRWQGTNGFLRDWSSEPEAEDRPLSDTTYTAEARCLVPACEGTSAPLDVPVRPTPVLDAGAGGASCAGAELTLGGSPTAGGGAEPYGYSWSAFPPDPTVSCIDCPNPTARPVRTTTYTLFVVDQNGCDAQDQVVWTIAPLPLADAGPERAVCAAGAIEIGGSPTASGGAGSYVYAWTSDPLDPSMSCSDCPNPTVGPAADTAYTVLVTDASGCEAVDATLVAIAPAPAADAGPARESCPGNPLAIGGSPTASGGSGGPYTYAWRADPPDPSMSCSDCSNPEVDPAVVTTYTVQVTDSLGCGAGATSTATVTPVLPEAPPPVGDSLRLVRALFATPPDGDDLVLSWQDTGGSTAGYAVRRSDAGEFPPPGDPAGAGLSPLRLDGEVGAGPSPRFFRVVAVNCAGVEGPL